MSGEHSRTRDRTANAVTAEVLAELAGMETPGGSPFPMPNAQRIRAAVARGLLAGSPRGSRINYAVQPNIAEER